MALTVERLAASIKGYQMRCIAGFEGLSNDITCFTIVDTPDIARWVRKGAFVASVGYVTNENPRLKVTLVRDLAQKGCACLAIKANRYYEESKEEFIEQGNLYKFPILEVDYSLRFSDIAYQIHQSMFEEKMNLVEKENLLYNQLSYTLLSDTDLEEALYNISIAVSNPIILLDRELNLIEFEDIADNPVDLHSLLNLKRGTQPLSSKETRTLLKTSKENLHTPQTVALQTDGGVVNIAIGPISFQEQLLGYLAIPETATHLTEESYRLMETVQSALGIYYVKNKYTGGESEHRRTTFANKVLLNEAITRKEIQHYATIFGFDTKRRRVCMDIYVRAYERLPYDRRTSIRNALQTYTAQLAEHFSLGHFFANVENHFPVFFFFPVAASNADIRNEMDSIAQEIVKLLQEMDCKVSIGVSTYSDDVAQIPVSFKQAAELVRLGERVQPDSFVHTYDDLQVYYMLSTALSVDELRNFADLVWGLYLEDQRNATHFIDTLDIYIKCRFNMTKTASMLYLHRNSLAYRIKKIEDILGIAIDQQQDVLRIQLSICALKLYLTYCDPLPDGSVVV